mgnify:CR=1 FL=1
MSAYHFALNDSIVTATDKATLALIQSLRDAGMFDRGDREDAQVLFEEIRNLVTNHLKDINK